MVNCRKRPVHHQNVGAAGPLAKEFTAKRNACCAAREGVAAHPDVLHASGHLAACGEGGHAACGRQRGGRGASPRLARAAPAQRGGGRRRPKLHVARMRGGAIGKVPVCLWHPLDRTTRLALGPAVELVCGCPRVMIPVHASASLHLCRG
jgi:hypothetical protein